MDKEKARETASRLEEFFFKAERSAEQRQNICRAAICLAEKHIPDKATVDCTTPHGDNAPSVVALHDEWLYVLSVEAPDDGDNAIGKLRAFHVAADAGTAQFEASYEALTKKDAAVWRFKLADGLGEDFSLALETSKIGEPKLAKTLAEALGWQFPDGGESASGADTRAD